MCSRGDKCKYSHDLATIVTFNSKEKGICFDYLRNQCHRGLLCRFSHDLSNIAQQCQVQIPGGLTSCRVSEITTDIMHTALWLSGCVAQPAACAHMFAAYAAL